MSNIIKFPQTQDEDDNRGYIINGRDIKGVYCENLAAMKDYDNVYLGIKDDDGIIFNSEVIVEELP